MGGRWLATSSVRLRCGKAMGLAVDAGLAAGPAARLDRPFVAAAGLPDHVNSAIGHQMIKAASPLAWIVEVAPPGAAVFGQIDVPNPRVAIHLPAADDLRHLGGPDARRRETRRLAGR